MSRRSISDIGDLLRSYVQRAHDEDWRRVSERLPKAIPSTMPTIGDAMPSGFGGSAKWQMNAESQLNMALKHFEHRRYAEGFGPDRVARDVELATACCRRIRSMCETPTEHQIAPWLICQNYGQWPCCVPIPHIPKEDEYPPHGGMMLIPQFAFAKFRIDFALVAKFGEHLRIIAIECVGSASHDARRDFDRDLYLRGWNIPTVQASGSEIFNNPRAVAARVATLLLGWACPLGLEP